MIESLLKLLHIAPVMGHFHPLWSLCLPAEVEIATSAELVAHRLDDLMPHPEWPILITDYSPTFAARFLTHHMPDCPPPELINQALPARITTGHNLITHKEVGQRLVNDIQTRGYEIVILMLVDGLSYEDVKHWPYHLTPCLIDGPSITYAQVQNSQITPDIGFPAIIGNPPVARRLVQHGLPHSRGYSYWNREQNDVSAVLFSGMPLQRVRSINEAVSRLHKMELRGRYIQLVREGTDGLAHHRREVTATEVQSTVEAILDDFRQLLELLAEKECKSAAYLISDHGILWKHQHKFERLAEESSAHVRYNWERPMNQSTYTALPTGNGPCYLYHYPFIGRQIRSNDSGVHGGLSYWESVVPFVHVEVNV
jgi:hypothetical protein